MTSGISAIDGITARIRTIEQRFEPMRPPQARMVVPSSTPFEPFGEAYQRALVARSAAPATARQAVAAAPATLDHARARLLTRVTNTSQPTDTSTGVQPRGSIGGFGSMPIPAELQPFGNGRVPADELAPIHQAGHRLFAPAAAAWDDLVAAAAADGVELRITDSYRSYDNQVDLARRKGLYSEGGLAAKPGTSNHGWGLAVDADVTDPAVLTWIRANGPSYGWVEAVPREPWHWEFRPNQT